MTHQSPPTPAQSGGDPGRQVASLREALALVRAICGEDIGIGHDALLDEAASISAAYDRAAPIVQRRFDAIAGEVAAWAAAGVEALLASGGEPPRRPAQRLADELDDALSELVRTLH